MDGIHDLGGRAGLGPINPEANEPVFHSDWERSVLVMFPAMAMAEAFNLDQFRAAMEQIPPHDYLLSQYYEHWIHALGFWGSDAGIFDPVDLDRRTREFLQDSALTPPTRKDPELVAALETLIASGGEYRRPVDSPARFCVGDTVVVRADASTTHTRRASYTRGRTGRISAAHGGYVFPDTNANGTGEAPEHLYTVEFTAGELWSDSAEPDTLNHIDLWESYLLPA